MPREENEISKIYAYSYLSPNRGFLIYETLNKSLFLRASIILIDLENRFYELSDESYEFPFSWLGYYGDFLMGNPVVVANFHCQKERRHYAHIFEIEPSLSAIKSYRKIRVSQDAVLFNAIDGKLIFTVLSPGHKALENFTLVNGDGSFVQLENTSVRFGAVNLHYPTQNGVCCYAFMR